MKRNSLSLLFIILTLFITACGASSPEIEAETAVPKPAATSTAEPTVEPTVAPTVAPTAVPPTPEPTNTPEVVATVMATIVATKEMPQVQVKICAVFENGKKANPYELNVRTSDDIVIFPAGTDINTTRGHEVKSSSGCHSIKLPPGTYYAGAQVFKGSLYVGGSPPFEVRAGEPVDVEIVLEEI